MDIASGIARVLNDRIDQARTRTARGTVTAVDTATGKVTFSIGDLAGEREGMWIGGLGWPTVGDIIVWLDEGRGIPLVLGRPGQILDQPREVIWSVAGDISTFIGAASPIWSPYTDAEVVGLLIQLVDAGTADTSVVLLVNGSVVTTATIATGDERAEVSDSVTIVHTDRVNAVLTEGSGTTLSVATYYRFT